MRITPRVPAPGDDDGLRPVFVVVYALFIALATSVMVVALLAHVTA